MKCFVECMVQIHNIESLKLDFSGNCLGDNIQNIKYFVNGMKYLPKLKRLILILNGNYLGYFEENI